MRCLATLMLTKRPKAEAGTTEATTPEDATATATDAEAATTEEEASITAEAASMKDASATETPFWLKPPWLEATISAAATPMEGASATEEAMTNAEATTPRIGPARPWRSRMRRPRRSRQPDGGHGCCTRCSTAPSVDSTRSWCSCATKSLPQSPTAKLTAANAAAEALSWTSGGRQPADWPGTDAWTVRLAGLADWPVELTWLAGLAGWPC